MVCINLEVFAEFREFLNRLVECALRVSDSRERRLELGAYVVESRRVLRLRESEFSVEVCARAYEIVALRLEVGNLGGLVALLSGESLA